jgi:hypothetical protein
MSPSEIAIDTTGRLYVADNKDNCVRKVDTAGNTTTLSGDGTPGYEDGSGGYTGTTKLWAPFGVAVGASGLVVADSGNNRIRLLSAAGASSTVAGNGTGAYMNGTGGATGTAELYTPQGVVVDKLGNIYVADSNTDRIRKISVVP